MSLPVIKYCPGTLAAGFGILIALPASCKVYSSKISESPYLTMPSYNRMKSDGRNFLKAYEKGYLFQASSLN